MISKYELNARIYPTLITLSPILLLAIYFSIDYQNIYSLIGGLGLTTILGFILGQFGRDQGKKGEKKLWKEWGGAPSTQILRYSDDTLDKHTTSNIHSTLFNLTNIGSPNMREIENLDPKNSDEVYSSWANYLRGKTRDTSRYKLLFQENINYGFRRNLWGLKKPALWILSIIVATIAFFEYIKFANNNPISTNTIITMGLLFCLYN